MKEFVRRSYLFVSPLDRPAVERAWQCNPDAVVLDLEGMSTAEKAAARDGLKDLLPLASRGAAEVFVHIGLRHLRADARAAVWPGLNGVIVSHPEAPSDVEQADVCITELEQDRGVDPGAVEIVANIGTPRGLLHVADVVTASARITSVALDEGRLVRELGIFADPEEDPLRIYARGRLVVEGSSIDEHLHGHQGVYRVSLGYRFSVHPPATAKSEEVLSAAAWMKENGYNGGFCLHPSWVASCNAGFTPTDEQAAHHRRVREAYTAGIAKGRGAVSAGGGSFVERPIDELAHKIIALRAMCDQRDAQKAAARAKAGLVLP